MAKICSHEDSQPESERFCSVADPDGQERFAVNALFSLGYPLSFVIYHIDLQLLKKIPHSRDKPHFIMLYDLFSVLLDSAW